jgi:hypothetical protein
MAAQQKITPPARSGRRGMDYFVSGWSHLYRHLDHSKAISPRPPRFVVTNSRIGFEIKYRWQVFQHDPEST